MKIQKYASTWFSNVSVALIAVGGFQSNMPLGWRLTAILLSLLAFIAGIALGKEE